MFNGYNDAPLISYDFNQEKKHENVPKWSSYGHDPGLLPGQTQPNARQPEFWSGKSNFLGIPNVVKCNCTGCYPSSDKQSYQGDTTRHRPWLPRSFPVPMNGSNEPCKLPACQWDNMLSSNQGSCYPDTCLPYVQENGGKYPYFKHQNPRLAESNQPGVITSVKNADYPKKSKPEQNGSRQPVFCNPAAYSLTKRVDGRNYCDPIEKYSNVASYTVDQHIPRLPVVEPFTKAVPSNLSQSRVPSTGYRSVKENMPQSYVDLGFGDARKMCTEDVSEQRSEAFPAGQLQTGVHADFFNPEETQKMFFDNTRHPEYYPRNNFQDVIKRNSQVDNRKDCAMHDLIMSEQHYNIPRGKHQEAGGAKPSCDVFYPKEFDKMRPENHLPANSACFQRNDDAKSENMNVHSRLPPSALLFNDPRFADRTQSSFTCQASPVACRNYIRPEYSYQGYNTQTRYEYPGGLERNDATQYRSAQQPIPNCEQLPSQQGSGFVYDTHYQLNSDKTQQLYRAKNASPESHTADSRNPTYLEAIRSEELNKNGTSKISPLRLLRKKKFINVPQEPAPASSLDVVPGLDVRKFWSTWAEEEEENVAPTQMVVLDCQNIDPEQAKLLHLYETDPIRLDANSTVIKNIDMVKESTDETAEVKTSEPTEQKVDEPAGNETENTQPEEWDLVSQSTPESVFQKTSPSKQFKKAKSENRGKKKPEVMDKWTEKKFDFLKRAEESKAAEILRHEEEKKKIFETRLSLQQSLKKNEKPQEKYWNKDDESVPDRLSPFDENSRSDSPVDGNGNAANLPTSEYRRNKFLDYSDRKVMLGEDKTEKGDEDGSAIFDEPAEIKKETEKEEMFPKLKEESVFEMDDILRKMSEINFQNTEVKLENDLEQGSTLKKLKSGRKVKKLKSDHQPETDERTDKLTVETVTKPTIKFSIQKSHDLKISFKVLNSSKEYSDEDMGGEGAEDEEKGDEDSKNSTELITLKYKSIKRDGDRRQVSELKKCRKAFRRKRTPKTPVLKIKKSRYMPQEERDPLADDDDVSDKCSTSDGFQVKETMDSAKIKLTFKRHKGNFETEYKINNVEKVDAMLEEKEESEEMVGDRCRKSREEEKHEIFAEAGIENFQNYPELTSDVESVSTTQPRFESMLEEDSRNSSTSRDSYTNEEICDFQSEPFTELPSEVVTPESSEENPNIPQPSSWTEEGNKSGSEFDLPHMICSDDDEEKTAGRGNGEEFPPICNNPDTNVKQLTPDEVVSVGEAEEKGTTNFEKEENQEISLDFITSTNSQEIKSQHNSGKTAERESDNGENVSGELKENDCDLETGISESSCILNNAEEDGTTCASPKPADVRSCGAEEHSTLPSLDLEVENLINPPATPVGIVNDEGTQEVTKPFEEEAGDNGNHPVGIENDEGGQEVTKPFEGEADNSIHGEGEEGSSPSGTTDVNSTFQNLENPEYPLRTSPKGDVEQPKKSVSNFQNSPMQTDLLETPTEEKDVLECNYPSAEAVKDTVRSRFFENPDIPNSDLEVTSSIEGGRVDIVPEVTAQPSSEWGTERLPECRTTPEGSSPQDPPAEQCTVGMDNVDEDRDKPKGVNSPSNKETAVGDCSDFSPPPEKSEKNTESEHTCSDFPVELEDGEIVDSCDEPDVPPEKEEKSPIQSSARQNVDFVVRRIQRRHSINNEKSTWSRKKFLKAKSCPPEVTFTELPQPEMLSYIPVESIPLPLGPPPYENCFHFRKSRETHSPETKEKPKESPKEKEIPQNTPPVQSPTKWSPPPVAEKEAPPSLGILQRSSKIKFSFLKRSKFSKIGLKTIQDSKIPPREQDKEAKLLEKPKEEVCDLERSQKTEAIEVTQKECQIEEVPKGNVPDQTKEEEASKDVKCPDVGLPCDELREPMESMTDLIRDEFYECEDIPTSEDLTNGEDPEIEKVNDDKFRNIMQNCLENAKKFLNVGNLKLFSCSVDDLLDLDCRETSLEPEKPPNHISRDVLLTSFEEDAKEEDLSLSENIQSADISMDFLPSFCSDVCPEILPVDNWPYLEEEVPSSPTKSEPDETDLIPTVENALSNTFSKNGIDRRRRKRVVSETNFKRFRRKSLLCDGEALRVCSKIGLQRRNTIDSFTGATYGRDIRDIKDDIIRLKAQAADAESKSLKCRLSLDKIANKHGIAFKSERKDSENGGRVKSLDYRSPSWQPKVMLFRISKNELRKLLKSSKSRRRFASKSSDDSAKRKISCDLENKVAHVIKKLKSDPDIEKLYVKPVQEFREVTDDTGSSNEGKLIDLSGLDSIKGSVTSADPEARKRKKSRFRNLHTKRKTEDDCTKDSSAQSTSPVEPSLVDAEAVFAEIFKDCYRVSNPQDKTTKDDHRPRKKSEHTPDSRPHGSSKRSQNETETTRKSKEEYRHDRHHEKKHDHRDRRREKSEGREHRESENRKHSRHGSSHESSKLLGKRSPGGHRHSKTEPEPKGSSGESGEKKWRHHSPEASWVCEVCGFNDAGERIVHIKSHPFHCQSCHLAFKTEAHFIRHLTKKHKDIRNQHHCLLCELSFDTEDQYQKHLETREHRHLESVEKNTINTLFTLLTGAPCPVFGLVEMRPEWLPNQAGTVHFYHQATPLSLALQEVMERSGG